MSILFSFLFILFYGIIFLVIIKKKDLSATIRGRQEVFIIKYNERIREIREDHFLTQQKIADLLHIVQRTYSDYESGKTRIPVDSLIILAEFYNVSMDYITGISSLKKEFPQK